MKQIIIALSLLMIAAPAFATGGERWAAEGTQSVASANAGTSAQTVQYLHFGRGLFATKELCDKFINDQKILALGINAIGKTTTRRIDATCSMTLPGYYQ
jgi:hypothetical protein